MYWNPYSGSDAKLESKSEEEKSCHINAVRYLTEESGTDVNASGKDGAIALMVAARNDQMTLVQYLTGEYDSDVNRKATDGTTALMQAAQNGHIEVVQYLAGQCDANVNEEDNDGCTALMIAARSRRVDVVQYLTEQCGADVNVKAMNGATAARFAADGGYHAIQRILIPFLSVTDVALPKDTTKSPTSDHRLSCLIPPSEMELAVFSQNGNIGGDFQAKWLGADVVVKLFIPDASHSSFDDKVRLWQQLRHPNVLKMYGACQAGPHLQFFVCEYASQGSLRDYANLFSEDDSFEATQPPKLWKYLYEAALGLEYLHERGIVHGDLRCSNILIGSDGIAKLSNFALSGSTTRPGQLSSDVFRGTMRWQAPEILRGEPPSYMSDVYLLGMCLIEWLGQEIPWGEEEDEWT